MQKLVLKNIVRKKRVIYILLCLFCIRIIVWLEPAGLKREIKEWTSYASERFIVHVMEQSNLLVSYSLKDNSGFVDKIAKCVNDTSSVYSFVENNYSKQNLVVYDPNILKASAVTVADNSETTSSQESQTEEPVTAQEVPDGNIRETAVPVYSMEQLCDYNFLRSNLYVVPERASVIPEDLDASILLNTDLTIEKDASVPQILIFHTHGSETFVDSTDDLVNTGIIAAGSKLAEELSTVYGYNVIHSTELFDNVNGVFDRSKAYDYSRAAVQQILTDNPTIQVIIDLHRDGVNENTHLVTEINGKQTAQIMFFNGVSRSSKSGDIAYLYNRYRSENLAFSLQAKLEAMSIYPEFTRKNYIDAYQYNLDLLPRAMLIEAGAQTNTLQEELNAMEPLADIIDRVLMK